MKRLRTYFLEGLLYLAPFGMTVYIIYAIFKFVDDLLKDTLSIILKVDIPGLGLVIIFLIIILTGVIGRTIIAKPVKSLFKHTVEKTPFLKVIYSALSDLFSAFVGKDRKFNKPVLVLLNPISNIQKIGFLTEDNLSMLGEKDKVAVYFPHSYAFTGEMYIVPRDSIIPLNINPSQAMKFIISSGVSGWEEVESEEVRKVIEG
jgi:uncharacterized membrane protein